MDKEQKAIARLQAASELSLDHYGLPLIVTTSGGKDSSVCVALAQKAGIPFEVMHNHTTADAPETVYFVRQEFKRLEGLGIKCTISYPTYKGEPTSMWKLIPQKLMPPTRLARYCCQVLKEQGGNNRFITTGVRWAESAKRANSRGIYEQLAKEKEDRITLNNDNDDRRRLFETCSLKAKRVVNPIIDWEDRDVWDYIHAEKIPVNPLYECGFSRVGCVGCPLGGRNSMQREFALYPKYETAYKNAFAKMLEARKAKGLETKWETADDVFRWWIGDPNIDGQMALDFEEASDE